MAWNELPARNDPNLVVQIYYLRLNALPSLLSRESVKLFTHLWESASSADFASFKRSILASVTIADSIRSFALEEITESQIEVGEWFVHSGVTHYLSHSEGNRSATIRLPDGKTISATVRSDCYITNTASVNMVDDDDISLVVGRLLSPTKFDLIAAGYRDPLPSFAGGGELDLSKERSAFELAANLSGFGGNLPLIKYDGFDDGDWLRYVVQDMLTHFGNCIRDQGAWRFLYDRDGCPVHELQHQSLFRMFANFIFRGFGITVHPGANCGNGATDLTLALRRSVHIVEFKKDHDRVTLSRGLLEQLPAYIRSADARSGTFVVLCHRYEPKDVRDMLTEKLDELKAVPYPIDISIIDCRRQVSASIIGR
ncbi:hypothetical protein ACWED2_34575 [Amycolatopsis sp. NPDC005003]